ncbi:glutathione S-transferase protein [Cooperia oncophora]
MSMFLLINSERIAFQFSPIRQTALSSMPKKTYMCLYMYVRNGNYTCHITFDGRGVAETARQLFALADQKYEDVRLTREAFAPLKETFPFGQMPVLEVDGKQLAQSLAINRYLARTFGKSAEASV